ncbi:MAG: flavin reductase family protein [Gordonia sp. (in: high G+C Gram-positive bacteria)]
MSGAPSELDQATLRRAFGKYPSGVVAICAVVDDDRVGLAASTFVPVSLDPPLVAFCIQNSSATWPVLRRSESLGVSVLARSHHSAARILAAKSGDRFSAVTTTASDSGAVFIDGASLSMDTSVLQEIPAGDHFIVVLAVNRVSVLDGPEPLVFHQSTFRQLTDVTC